VRPPPATQAPTERTPHRATRDRRSRSRSPQTGAKSAPAAPPAPAPAARHSGRRPNNRSRPVTSSAGPAARRPPQDQSCQLAGPIPRATAPARAQRGDLRRENELSLSRPDAAATPSASPSATRGSPAPPTRDSRRPSPRRAPRTAAGRCPAAPRHQAERESRGKRPPIAGSPAPARALVLRAPPCRAPSPDPRSR